MNKKIKKLARDPKLFFTDMVKKRLKSPPIKYTPWKRVEGGRKYTVVSAVYGVEKYLDQYFSSIVNQSLHFEKHIELIMVDDGSLDGSAHIIKKWAKRYPNNIFYHKKKNAGQASARNYGMKFVSNSWVTFIDPDDFLDVNYFNEVDNFITEQKNIALVACNCIFYIENRKTFEDKHALKNKFQKNKSTYNVFNLNKNIQLSASSAFFKMDVIVNQQLEMKSTIKPTFEDAYFVCQYLLELNNERVGFIKSAKYYYRKRDDTSSTLDGAWQSKEQYTSKLKYGYLGILKYAEEKKGEVPDYIQNTVLYDYVWYIKHLINHQENISFLNSREKDEFFALSLKIFSYIDEKIIDQFNLAGCWFFHKVGMLGLFKDIILPFQIVYVEDYDAINNLVQLKYFYSVKAPFEHFTLDGIDTVPTYSKIRTHDYLDQVFVYEKIVGLPLNQKYKKLFVSLGEVESRLSIGGKHYHKGVDFSFIVDFFSPKSLSCKHFPASVVSLREESQSLVVRKKYINAWLFMDRDIQADDNAEHLYRYVSKYHSDINAYFVLRNTSHDWKRLEEEGFNLLDFNSRDHQLALLNSVHVISSHADHYVVSLLEKKWFSDLLRFKYTFLQHGITKDDLSNWLNNKPIDVLVTGTKPEFHSIADDDNRYKFTSKEVALTGFPRHDHLLKLNSEVKTEKLIVIMPTWRQGIVGDVVGEGNTRELVDSFYSSQYALAWKSFLHSEKLKQQIDAKGFTVIFFPHTNIQPYLNWFKPPSYINTVSHTDIDSMQTLFCRAALMITDYSSVAFEMAYINKAIVYYQFDYNFVFGGGHLTNKGYYDYKRDGFGPVCDTEKELLLAVSDTLNNNAKPSLRYLERMERTFAYRDGLCCQRVFEAISNLDKPMSEKQNISIAVTYAHRAMESKQWDLAINRWLTVYRSENVNKKILEHAALSLLQSYRLGGKLGEANKWMQDVNNSWNDISLDGDKKELQIEWSKLLISFYSWECIFKYRGDAHSLMLQEKWEEAFNVWGMITPEHYEKVYISAIFFRIECLAQLEKWEEIEEEVRQLSIYELSEVEVLFLRGWEYAAKEDVFKALEIWKDNVYKLSDISAFSNAFILLCLKAGEYPAVLRYLDDNSASFNFFKKDGFIVPLLPSVLASPCSNVLSFNTFDFSSVELEKLIESLEYYGFSGEVDLAA